MDKDFKDDNGFTNEPLMTVESNEVENHADDSEDYSESNTLLPPRRGGISRNPQRVRRNVQWNDNNGNKLTEVLIFEPSDNSDSDEEDSDSCACTIM